VKTGEPDFIDALFTATSATCVTGLVVVDTGTYFSVFGQVVIMILIQIGGLGFMTMATLFAIVLRKRISLK
jgi:trk system potassium uptake protein